VDVFFGRVSPLREELCYGFFLCLRPRVTFIARLVVVLPVGSEDPMSRFFFMSGRYRHGTAESVGIVFSVDFLELVDLCSLRFFHLGMLWNLKWCQSISNLAFFFTSREVFDPDLSLISLLINNGQDTVSLDCRLTRAGYDTVELDYSLIVNDG
jgi:hypothetical protein